MDTTQQLPTVISFCSGYGGIERGLDLAGVEHRVLAYVEIEAFAIANLVAKMETGQLVPAPIFTDLKTFPAHLFRGCVDIITGGYPCQPFSAAGKRLGTEDPRHLWPFIRQHIQTIRPVWCMFENVEGHISLGLREVIGDLEGAGYQATWGIFSAAEVDAPHQRKRVYIMANAGGRRFSETNEWQDQQPGRAEVVSAGEELADTKHLADSAGKFSERRIAEGVASWKPEEAIGDRGAFASVADTINARPQRPSGYGENLDQQGRYDKEQSRSVSAESIYHRKHTAKRWPPEPRLGRVVDGCPDRVDRIRLLGNGVVPQTAARAWETLTKRLT